MNPEKIGKNIAKFLLMEEITETVAIYPGAFKPPHKGHVDVILKALNFSLNNDRKVNGPTMPSSTQTPGKAIVFVSEKTRENVDYNESLAVWDLYKEAIPELNNVEFISTPTPVTDVYHYVKENPTHDIKAVFGKGEESRFERLQDKSKYPNVELFNAGTFQDLSATNLRKAISNKDKETIKTFIPDGVDVDKFLSIFQSDELNEGRKKKKDPKKGTGKKPKGSSRRLYTDEDPKDTVGVKFSSRQDIVDTFNKKSFKAKSHARQSQVINLVHQRVRAAYNRAKDPAVKKRLKTALAYAEKRKEASKKKTQRLKKLNENFIPGKAIIYPDFQGVDIDNNITGRRKVLNVVDCIGNEPNKDYNYFTTEKKDYVEDMVKNASGDGWKTFDPIVAIPHPLLNGKYLVIDGNHRLGAFVIGKLPKIKALVLSEDQILLAAPGSKWDGNNLPETIPLKDSKGKVNLKDYFSTEPLKVPTTEGDTYEKMAAKGKKRGNLKQGTVRKRLNIPKGEKIPLSKISKEISRIKKMENPSEKNKKYLKALNLAKTLKTTTNLNEAWEPQKAKVINKFLHFASDYLNTDRPKIKLLNGPEFTQTYHSFGGYHPGEENIQIVVYNRNMADILRTLAHEMVHRMQHLDNRLGPNSGDDGSPEENEANALAGVMLRQFGRENPGIYE